MSSPRHSRPIALLLSLVPGWGHVYLGLERLGLAVFTTFAVGGFVVLNALVTIEWQYRIPLVRGVLLAMALLWLVSWGDVFRRTSPRRLRLVEEEKSKLLRAGMVAYLKGDLDGAEDSFRSCLKLDQEEVEALVRLGIVLTRCGRFRKARRALCRARALDLEGKWTWEIDRELHREKGAPLPLKPEAGGP